MNRRIGLTLLAVVLVAAVVGTGAWFHTIHERQMSRIEMLEDQTRNLAERLEAAQADANYTASQIGQLAEEVDTKFRGRDHVTTDLYTLQARIQDRVSDLANRVDGVEDFTGTVCNHLTWLWQDMQELRRWLYEDFGEIRNRYHEEYPQRSRLFLFLVPLIHPEYCQS